MAITAKQKKDMNRMNVASQNIGLGDIVDGLNTLSTQSASAVNITGGVISGVKYGSEDSYTSFENDGTMVATGSATCWDDLFFPLTVAKQGQTDQPQFSATEIAYLFPQNDTSHIMYIIVQLPHDWEIGTEIHPHVHWKQNKSGSVIYKMDYKWFDLGKDIPSTFQTYVMDENAVEYTSGSIHQLNTGSALISGSHIESVSSIMLLKLYRDDNTYIGDAITYQFDIHIKKDTIGSRTELLK